MFSASNPVSAQWKKITNIPPPYDAGYYLDVFFLPSNPQLGWISGVSSLQTNDVGYVIRTTDGGKTWQGSNAGRNGRLESVHFVTPLIGYTSGTNGIYKSIDGGVSWRNITPQSGGNSMWGCFFINQNVGLVVADGCDFTGQTFLRTVDGGINWVPFFGNVSNSGMSDVMLYSQDGLGYGSSSGVIWRTNDGGRTWSYLCSTGPNYWQEEITNINNSFLVPTSGDDCTGTGANQGELRFSTDLGKSWGRFQTNRSMFGTFLINEISGWGVGNDACVYYTSDAGVSWQNRNCGIDKGVNLDDVWFATDSNGWAVGDGVYQTNFIDPPKVQITAGKPLTFCEGDSVSLEASDGFTEYKWSNGATGQKIWVKEAGVHRVLAYDKNTCKEAFDSVFVTLYNKTPPIVKINRPKPVICDGDTLTLTVNESYRSYKWSTGDTTPSIRVALPGAYSVIVIDENGCIGESSSLALIAVPAIKPNITALRNFTFCIGDSLLLNAPDGFVEYKWSNGETLSKFYIKEGGLITVTVKDSNGCYGMSEFVNVRALDAKNKIEILSVLTDNTFDFESVTLKERSCQDVILHNRNDSLTYYIEAPFLVRNMLFSIPQSQLPVSIPAGGTVPLKICYAPVDTLIQTDTLILPDTCSDIRVALRAKGKPYIINSNSQCDIPVRGVVYELGQNYYVSKPFPQPTASNQIQVNFSAVGDESIYQTQPSATLHDMFGTQLRASIFEVTNRAKQMNFEMEGKFTFTTDTITSGMYYILIHIQNNVKVLPVIIEK